jgi:hypothetical protein
MMGPPAGVWVGLLRKGDFLYSIAPAAHRRPAGGQFHADCTKQKNEPQSHRERRENRKTTNHTNNTNKEKKRKNGNNREA